ncbi:hypothetical protein MRX96_047052 [Rhipicephalus microplus]
MMKSADVELARCRSSLASPAIRSRTSQRTQSQRCATRSIVSIPDREATAARPRGDVGVRVVVYIEQADNERRIRTPSTRPHLRHGRKEAIGSGDTCTLMPLAVHVI